MAFINKKNLDKVCANIWPNPYDLSDKDCIGKLEGMPIEIVNLALKEIERQKERKEISNDIGLHTLQRIGVGGSFFWRQSIEGNLFWSAIDNGNYSIFYEKYNPKSLKKSLES